MAENLTALPNFSDFPIPGKLKVIYSSGTTAENMSYIKARTPQPGKPLPQLAKREPKNLPFGSIVNIVSKEVVPYKTSRISQDLKYLVTDDGFGILYARNPQGRPEPTRVFSLISEPKATDASAPAPAPASASAPAKIDWIKILVGIVTVALIGVLLAYILKKRSRKELLAFGAVGGVLGGIGAFLMKDKPLPLVGSIADKIGGNSDDKIVSAIKDTASVSEPPKTITADDEKKIREGLAKLNDKEKEYLLEVMQKTAASLKEIKGMDKKDPKYFEKSMGKMMELGAALEKKYGKEFAYATNEKIGGFMPKQKREDSTSSYVTNTMAAWDALNIGPLMLKK